MVADFEEPIGPLADVSELLYIVALHQASIEYKTDVSVTAKDISLFLLSRHGAECSPEKVQELIMKDVGAKRMDVKDEDDTNEIQLKDQEIKAQEVSTYLQSKFGITIKPEDLQNMMANGQGGHSGSSAVKEQANLENISKPLTKQSNEEASSKMDLIELIALMWIPEFRKLVGPKQELELLHALDVVTDAMIHDLRSSGSPDLELTPALVRDLFLCHGETTLAQDEELIKEMVQAATSGLGDKDQVLFDKDTLVKALTHDIQQYNLEHEDTISTNWDDVFGKDTNASSANLGGKRMAASIDMAAHTYLCRIQMIVNWLFFVFTYFAYVYNEMTTFTKECPKFQYQSTWPESREPVNCTIGYSILDWLISFSLICVAGMLFVGLGSFGNDATRSSLPLKLFAMAFLIFLTVYFPLMHGILVEGQEPLTFARMVALAMGIVTTYARFRLILRNKAELPLTSLRSEALIKKASASKIIHMQRHAVSVHEPSSTKSTAFGRHFGMAIANFSKQSPQYRSRFQGTDYRKEFMSGRIISEDGIFFSGRFLAGNFAQLILFFVIMGFGYTSTRYVWNNWIPYEDRGDQIASNLEMIITRAADQSLVREAVDGCLKMFTLFLLRVLYFLDNAGLLRLDCILLGNFLQAFCQNALLDDDDDGDFACSLFAGAPEELCGTIDPLFRPTTPLGKALRYEDIASVINTASLVDPVAKVVSQAMSDNIETQVNHFYPQSRYMVVYPVAIGAGVATLCALLITRSFLPSITATTLKLRKGVLPSACDPKARELYTFNVHNGTFVFGGMFWGILASSLLVGGIIGIIIFLAMWQVTAFLIMQAVAFCIGISVTLLIKWLLTRFRRSTCYLGFYRTNPLQANISGLFTESFNFATSMAYAAIRMLKLLLLAAFYVGRIDARFLDPSANKYLGGLLYIDIFPEYFIADILSTEAHRHPYIERLGVMYLYKLKHGSEFATRAGSAWRLLFVTALMPWLQKYRIASRQMITEAEPESVDKVMAVEATEGVVEVSSG